MEGGGSPTLSERILTEAYRHHSAGLHPAEWMKEDLGSEWTPYRRAAQQLEADGLVDLAGSSFPVLLSVLLTGRGKQYCEENGIL